ncbi:MAG: D-alanine--D-alanine ligase [Bacteroidetes bacterium]|nr:D-alanine--D-alanine ligase [Bacteroidota bacterium]
MSLIHIALVTGGYSGESVISYRTARTIQQQLDSAKYKTYWIDITQEGWYYQDETGLRWPVDKNDFTVALSDKRLIFDVAFVAMHGTPGEDGKLPGYFEMIGLPYTSCNAFTSAITFNKRVATAFAGAAGIPVAKSVLLIRGDEMDWEKSVSSLQLPVFVKPNNGGSSIGMSKVNQPGTVLYQAIEKAFQEDAQVLVEEMIPGREFTVGVFNGGGTITVLPITEVSANPDMPFFDFEAKYQGKSTEITPAIIPTTWADQLISMAKHVYQTFQCRGVVRIDFIYHEKEQRPYMLELNSIPGQSEASIIPQQVITMGWTLAAFYDQLVTDCLTNQQR